MKNTSALEIEQLLRETNWLRSLARGLLRDPGRADDAVQDTLLIALERAPREASERGRLRGWLAAVLRNRVRDEHRSERSRGERQRIAARPEALEVDSSLEALSVQRDVVEAVLALDEPYREVIVLRYLRGHDVNETARRLGIHRRSLQRKLQKLAPE